MYLIFLLFQDESVLIWFSGKEEKRLKLTNVSRIISGQRTVSLSNDNEIIDIIFLLKIL